jgi:hypothetical protein
LEAECKLCADCVSDLWQNCEVILK